MDELEIVAQIISELSPQALSRALEYHLTTRINIERYISIFEIAHLGNDTAHVELLNVIKKYMPELFIYNSDIAVHAVSQRQNSVLIKKNHMGSQHEKRASLIRRNNENNFQLSKAFIEEFSQQLLDRLSKRARKVIKELGYYNIIDFLSIDIEKIKELPNIGKKIIAELLNLKNKALQLLNKSKSDEIKPESFTLLPTRSILKAPLALLFGYENPGVLDSSSKILNLPLVFSSEQWDILNRLNLFFEDDPADILISNTIGVLVQRTLPSRLINFLFKNAFVVKIEKNIIFSGFASNIPFLDDKYKRFGNIPISYLVDSEISSKLRDFRYCMIENLCDNSEIDVLNKHGFSFDVMYLIFALWNFSNSIKAYFKKNQNDLSLKSASINDMFENLIINMGYSQREACIFKARFFLTNEYGHTLEELGLYFNVTRERIRQIESKIISAFKISLKKEIKTFLILLEQYVKENGIVSVFEIANFIKACLGLDATDNEIAYGYLSNIFFEFQFDKIENVVIYPGYQCVNCKNIRNYINERLIIGRTECTITQLENELFTICNTFRCNVKLNRQALLYLLNTLNNINIDNDIVYSNGPWAFRRGSLGQKIEEIALESKAPLHFKQIYKILREKFPEEQELDKRTVYLLTSKNNHLLLWDRGTYVHYMNVLIDKIFIEKIENWLEKEIENLPMLLVNRVFDKFKEECKAKGIISESALYTCLRQSKNNKFVFPKYPQIFLAKNYQSRITTNEIIERYILEIGGPISSKFLKDYSINKIGLKQFQLTNFLASSNDILKFSENEYIHIDNINIDTSKIYEIFDFISELIIEHKHISIIKVYNFKKVSCMKMGIRNPYLLYELLKRNNNSRYRFSRYPILELVENSTEKYSGILNKIALYIKNKTGFCTYSELEDEFVEKLGYKPATVKLVSTCPMIYKYTSSSLIHEESLGILGLIDKVEQVATDVLMEKSKIGINTATIEDLIDAGLPKLHCNLPWTTTLLASIISRSKRIIIIGNARQVIGFRKGNSEDNFESIVASIIKDLFGGAVEIHELEKALIERKLILKSFSATMLPIDTKICIKGNTVFLKDIDLYA